MAAELPPRAPVFHLNSRFLSTIPSEQILLLRRSNIKFYIFPLLHYCNAWNENFFKPLPPRLTGWLAHLPEELHKTDSWLQIHTPPSRRSSPACCFPGRGKCHPASPAAGFQLCYGCCFQHSKSSRHGGVSPHRLLPANIGWKGRRGFWGRCTWRPLACPSETEPAYRLDLVPASPLRVRLAVTGLPQPAPRAWASSSSLAFNPLNKVSSTK